jgi:hypothetical protein
MYTYATETNMQSSEEGGTEMSAHTAAEAWMVKAISKL